MANTSVSEEYRRKAIIDTAPGSEGFWLPSVSIRQQQVDRLFFSIKGNQNAIVTLQFKHTDDTDWTNYDTYTLNGRYVVQGGGAATEWRAGVEAGNYTSGITEITFDW